MTANHKALAPSALRWRLAVPSTAGLLLALLVWSCGPQPLRVELAPVTRGPLEETVGGEGEARALDLFEISAPVAGQVLSIDLDPGDSVVAGETVLAILQPGDLSRLDRRALAEVQSRARAAEAALRHAQDRHARAFLRLLEAEVKAMYWRENATKSDTPPGWVEAAMREWKAAEEAVRDSDLAAQSARQALTLARAALVARGELVTDGPLILRAPISGAVLDRFRKRGATVSEGDLLLRIGDPTRFEIVAELPARDAMRVTASDAVHVVRPSDGARLSGVIRRVDAPRSSESPAGGADTVRSGVPIDLMDPCAGCRLVHGERVDVGIVVWRDDDVLRVPTAALFRGSEGEWAVFVAEEGRAVRRTIGIGRRSELEAEVLSGLEAGERVIVHPGDAVAEGVEIEVEPEAP